MELAYSTTTDTGYIQVYDRAGGTWGTLYLGSGNVGIGTNTPSSNFEVYGSAPMIEISNTTEDQGGIIFNDSADPNNQQFRILFDCGSGSGSTNALNFYYGSGILQARIRRNDSAQNDDGWVAATLDYGEFMPKFDPDEMIRPFEVVGLKNGRVTKNTDGATLCMLTSTQSGIRGGNPLSSPRDNEDGFVVVAYSGQVQVLVEGDVAEGDYILPSGKNDGKAVAVSPEHVDFRTYRKSIGVVLNIVDESYLESLGLEKDCSSWSENVRDLLSRKGEYIIANVAVGVK
jgi:hypothetical protein